MKRAITGTSAVARASLALLLAGTVTAAPVRAESVAEFYSGKQVSILLGTGPGRTYDLYARLLAKHMARHIPGNPTMIVQYMRGAGGLKATNHMYNVAPQDGTALATLFASLPGLQLTKPDAARYDARKFNWIGAFSATVSVLSVMDGAPATTLDDAKRTEVAIGSIGRNNSTYQFPALVNHVLGTRFKLISGYPSGAEIYKAMEAGEVHGYAPVWLSLAATKADWLRSGRVKVLVQGGLKKLAALPDVPLLVDLAKTEDERRMVVYDGAGAILGRSLLTTPGVPPDRLAALEAAFVATVSDPEYLADAKRQNLPISYSSKAEVVESVEQILSTPPALIERIKTVFGG